MNLRTELLVIGAGLAGASAAFFLGMDRQVMIVDQSGPAAGASGAAAGLINPLPGRRARPVWRMREALEALHVLFEEIGDDVRFPDAGILRPAADREQAQRFIDSTALHPDLSVWMEEPDVAMRWPDIRAPHGALHVADAGAVSIPALCSRLTRRADVHWGWTFANLREEGRVVNARFVTPDGNVEVAADHVVMAVGANTGNFIQTRGLNLHPVKGQVITVELEARLPDDQPQLAGSGFVVLERRRTDEPSSKPSHRLILGSTYEHGFTDEHPTAEATAQIIGKTKQLMPALESARVVDARAGIRMTVPGTRLPMIGPIPDHRRTWVFSGLGTKGLLMAPLIARKLNSWILDPRLIPHELRPRLHDG